MALFLVAVFASQAIAGGESKRPTANSGQPAGAAGSYAKGEVRGQPFEVKFVDYDATRLVFKSAPQPHAVNFREQSVVTGTDAFTGICLTFSTPQRFGGEYFLSDTGLLVNGDQTQPLPQLVRYTVVDKDAQIWHSSAPYYMKLKFFKPVKGMLPGYIDLSVTNGKERTFVKGFFYAVQKPIAL